MEDVETMSASDKCDVWRMKKVSKQEIRATERLLAQEDIVIGYSDGHVIREVQGVSVREPENG